MSLRDTTTLTFDEYELRMIVDALPFVGDERELSALALRRKCQRAMGRIAYRQHLRKASHAPRDPDRQAN